MASSSTISSQSFYSNYIGHLPAHLRHLIRGLKASRPNCANVYLLGDSSLDNKFWLPQQPTDAINGYEDVLDPPYCEPDIAFCLNEALARVGSPPGGEHWVAINAAVEESTIAARSCGKTLLPQDEIVRDCLTSRDVLVVSIGGNDIALRPSVTTAASMAWLSRVASDSAIDDGSAMGLAHFTRMFKDDVGAYLSAVCAKAKPRLIILCMIYYPHVASSSGSWADAALGALNYNANPGRLQRVIRRVYTSATSQVTVPGVRLVPCPLFEVLDASPASQDYVARVEPSVAGGRKMAQAFVDIMARELA